MMKSNKPIVKLPPVRVSNANVNEKEIPFGVSMVNAPEIWETTRGNGVVVAVLDTGVSTKHPDLQGRIIDGRNFTPDFNGDPNTYEDNQSHGTHVAGTICAIANSIGVVGVAPDVQLLVGKVLDHEGSGDYDSIVSGVRWAVDWRGKNGERARVISMSLGGPFDYKPLHDVIKYAVDNNVAVVVAAGNEGDGTTMMDEYSYPGMYDEVIEVGAIDQYKLLADFSNTNDQIDVVAPGVDVLSTVPNGWAKMSGTSMATPHVSAVIALLISMYETNGKELTEPEIYQLLLEHTVKISDDKKGFGNGLTYLHNKPEPIEAPSRVSVQVSEGDNGYSIQITGISDKEEVYKIAEELTYRFSV
jgi:major intracellular serine protease